MLPWYFRIVFPVLKRSSSRAFFLCLLQSSFTQRVNFQEVVPSCRFRKNSHCITHLLRFIKQIRFLTRTNTFYNKSIFKCFYFLYYWTHSLHNQNLGCINFPFRQSFSVLFFDRLIHSNHPLFFLLNFHHFILSFQFVCFFIDLLEISECLLFVTNPH